MILHRWRLVNGCVEWLTLHVKRYVGPVVRGLPSLGPCTKAAIIGLPFLGVPGAAFAPPEEGWSQGGFYFPQGWGGWFAPYVPYGYEYPAGVEASLPTPADIPLTPGEGLLAVPGTNINIVSENETPPLDIASVIHILPVDNVNIPPNEQVPEPATIAIVAVGAGAAILIKRRRA